MSKLRPLSKTSVAELIALSSAPPTDAYVFIHGIFSSHDTFETLATKLEGEGLVKSSPLLYFDYNFNNRIEDNALKLADVLHEAFSGTDLRVTLIAHSMGGLVARVAILAFGERLTFVRRLIMLATPNHGCLHTARLGMLAQLKVREIQEKRKARRQGRSLEFT
jgi:pimeloyl-ACP methyl ester carboxylesterase